jgi:hypothetical protein
MLKRWEIILLQHLAIGLLPRFCSCSTQIATLPLYNFMKSTNWLKLLVGDIQTDKQTGDLINLLSFLESRLKTKELHNLYSSPDIISQVKANLSKIHSDPIFPPTPWSSQWSLSFGLSHQNLVHFSLSPMRATCPAHLIRLDLTCLMISGDEYKL